MRCLIALAFLVQACGNASQPAYTTVHGIVVLESDTDMPYDQDDIEAGVEIVIDNMVARHPEDFTRDDILARLRKAKVRIEFVSGAISGATKTTLGRTYPETNGDAYVAVRDLDTFTLETARDVAHTSLAHELIHVIQNLYSIQDGNHDDKDYFQNKRRTTQENGATVEMEIHNDYVNALCSKYCNW